MECDRVRALLSDYLEETLAEGDRAGVASHLDGCARCAAAAEGLAQTLTLLSALPRECAPPELLNRVMKGIAAEAPGKRGWTRFFTPPRVKIPVEAAAAVFLIVLVYGIQKGMPVRSGTPEGGGNPPAAERTIPDASPPLPAAVSSSPAKTAGKGPSTAAGKEKAARPILQRELSRTPMADAAGEVPPARSARAESLDAGPPPAGGKAEFRGAAAPIGRPAPAFSAAPAFTLAPAARVSSAEETIEPKVFAAPPSRLFKPLPYGRDVTLDVTPAERAGIEGKIVAAAERLGGGAHPGAALRPESAQPALAGTVRVHLPAEAADAFLDALRTLGTIPPEGMPAAVDLPAGPSPGITAYTVRIRVR